MTTKEKIPSGECPHGRLVRTRSKYRSRYKCERCGLRFSAYPIIDGKGQFVHLRPFRRKK